ncbi:MAG: hypothetical protein H6Q14_371 [Bacteroidetes bacterium]|jgi:hypothetical protein|nr:hypothetical protein [Bacteroidota bacterium]
MKISIFNYLCQKQNQFISDNLLLLGKLNDEKVIGCNKLIFDAVCGIP